MNISNFEKVILSNLKGRWKKENCTAWSLRRIGVTDPSDIREIRSNYFTFGLSTPRQVHLVKKGKRSSIIMIEDFHHRYFMISNNSSLKDPNLYKPLSSENEDSEKPKEAVPGPNGFFI
jgi:hypothetical protein